MIRNIKSKFVGLTLALVASATVLTSCDNNPFLPQADLTILSIQSLDKDKGVGIVQSFKKAGETNVQVTYKYNEPILKIENKTGLPRVTFKEMIINFTVGNQKLPTVRRKMLVTVPNGGTYDGTVSILAQAEDVIYSVYPNDSMADISSGQADVVLIGLDENGNTILLPFTTSLVFTTEAPDFDVNAVLNKTASNNTNASTASNTGTNTGTNTATTANQ